MATNRSPTSIRRTPGSERASWSCSRRPVRRLRTIRGLCQLTTMTRPRPTCGICIATPATIAAMMWWRGTFCPWYVGTPQKISPVSRADMEERGLRFRSCSGSSTRSGWSYFSGARRNGDGGTSGLHSRWSNHCIRHRAGLPPAPTGGARSGRRSNRLGGWPE